MSTDTYQVNRVFRYFAQLLRALVCNVNRYISSYTHLIGFSLTSLSSKELFYVMSTDTYQVIHI